MLFTHNLLMYLIDNLFDSGGMQRRKTNRIPIKKHLDGHVNRDEPRLRTEKTKLSFAHIIKPNPLPTPSRFHKILSRYRPWHFLDHERPTLDRPHHQTRDLPPHD